jgi:undecaprenyl-diphosphatase
MDLTFTQLAILALIQAISEFLPISSSGHLWLVDFFLGWPYQGLIVDLALHAGTLAAVVIYFWKDLWALARAFFAIRPGVALDTRQRLAIGLIVGTLPGALAGLLLSNAEDSLRQPWLIACDLIVFGLLLWWADRRHQGERDEFGVNVAQAFMIGCAQALALVPGVSRSGVTITAALLLGLGRTGAARFSFLLAVPITAGAVAHGVVHMLRHAAEAGTPSWSTFFLGAAMTAVGGLACVHWLLSVFRRIGTLPFMIYRVALGIGVLAVLWSR